MGVEQVQGAGLGAVLLSWAFVSNTDSERRAHTLRNAREGCDDDRCGRGLSRLTSCCHVAVVTVGRM